VNAGATGMTDTSVTVSMVKRHVMREKATRQYLLGGVQTADQVAEVMAWLLGDRVVRLTGQVIAADSGFITVFSLVK
jgi:enoyl-[acyl-carrier-protein] reductase (NADH)